MSDVLQEFVNLGLLDIEGDDSRLEKLRAAAGELAERIKSSPRLAIYHTLTIATDDPTPTDSTFTEVSECVENHWKTYKNRFPEVPRQVFKAVSLQALSLFRDSGEAPAKFGVGYIWRSIKTHDQPVREQVTIRRVLDGFESDLEEHAAQLWTVPAIPQSAASPNLVPTVMKIDRAKLASSVVAAAGPNNLQGQAIQGANPQWPSGNQAWTGEFGTRLAEAVSTTIEGALLQVAGEVGKSGKRLMDAIDTVSRQVLAVRRQNSLLWWRKSLYSPALKKSYRELVAPDAVIAMTIDFYNLLGGIAPTSAEHLLKEAVKEVCGVTPLCLSDVVKSAGAGSLKSVLPNDRSLYADRQGLKPLLQCLFEVGSDCSTGPVESCALVPTKLNPEHLACRLLQEYLALALTVGQQQRKAEGA